MGIYLKSEMAYTEKQIEEIVVKIYDRITCGESLSDIYAFLSQYYFAHNEKSGILPLEGRLTPEISDRIF